MSSIITLSTDDFAVQSGKKGNLLCILEMPGLVFALFHHPTCDKCPAVKRIFREIATRSKVSGSVQFASIEVTQSLAEKSKQTILPITYVPLLILYVGGRPFMKYNGAKDGREIEEFLLSVSSKLNVKTNFGKGSKKQLEDPGEIPSVERNPDGSLPFNLYCEGANCYLTFDEMYGGKAQDCKDGECCYLTFEEIYSKENKKSPPQPQPQLSSSQKQKQLYTQEAHQRQARPLQQYQQQQNDISNAPRGRIAQTVRGSQNTQGVHGMQGMQRHSNNYQNNQKYPLPSRERFEQGDRFQDQRR